MLTIREHIERAEKLLETAEKIAAGSTDPESARLAAEYTERSKAHVMVALGKAAMEEKE